MRTDTHPSQLKPGDVLLCRGNTEGVSLAAYVSGEIAAATSSPYTHAALYLGEGQIVDARILQGIRVRPLTELIASTQYIAAMRQPGAWDAVRVDRLRAFAKWLDELGAKYNTNAVASYVLEPELNRKMRWEAHRKAHHDSVMEKIEAAFAQPKPPQDDPQRKYFCSELVVAAFVHVGYLGPGADVIYDPGHLAPGDIPRDHTFGFLVGYLAKGPSFDVPGDDPLLGTTLVSSVPPF
jgi:hypothetical protein